MPDKIALNIHALHGDHYGFHASNRDPITVEGTARSYHERWGANENEAIAELCTFLGVDPADTFIAFHSDPPRVLHNIDGTAYAFVSGLTPDELQTFLGALFERAHPEDEIRMARRDVVTALEGMGKVVTAWPTEDADSPEALAYIVEVKVALLGTDTLPRYDFSTPEDYSSFVAFCVDAQNSHDTPKEAAQGWISVTPPEAVEEITQQREEETTSRRQKL